MIPNKVSFKLHERPNNSRKRGKEWALDMHFDGHSNWTLTTYENKPSVAGLQEDKTLILRAFQVYHQHLRIPAFNLIEEI